MTGTNGRPAPLPPLPRCWVYFTDPDETGDDPVHVRVRQQDMVAWEETAAKHKWPPMMQVPTTFMLFTAWHALRTAGKLPAGFDTWESFRDNIYGVAPEETDDAAAAVDPTQPAPITG